MYVLKGFANHAQFAVNTPGTNSAIGELSSNSLTYSRELGQYVDPIAPSITLISFLSATDGTKAAIEIGFKTRTMTIIDWIYDRTLSQSSAPSAAQFLEDILVEFQTKAANFECGLIVTANGRSIPEWVSWKDTSAGSPAENFVKIWFVDASFAAQYDEFEIIVIPPLTPLDDFFKAGSAVETAIKARTVPQTMDLIQAAKGGFPETILRAETYDYHDPLNAQHIVPTNWSLLIYGIAGNNIDSIKDALVDFILNHSGTTHTRDQWAEILPDIFKRTEYVLVPGFNAYSIPYRQGIENGIYSPFMNRVTARSLLAEYAPDYEAAHIDTHGETFGHPYKSVAIAVVGSPENRDAQYELVDVFPDYIAVASTSNDFNRMSQETQGWATLISNMIIQAESMGPYTSLPAGMTRLTRNNKLYVVASYDNIHYLVAAKYNFPAVNS